MKTKTLKSFRTLAGDLKSRRKPKLSPEQIDKANKIFEKIEKEQIPKTPSRKIARQPEFNWVKLFHFQKLNLI